MNTKKKKIEITIDKDKQEVLKLDQAGNELIFDESVEKFPKYDDKFIKQLSFVNQRNYFVSQGLNIGAKRVAEEKPSGIEVMPVVPRQGMATSRLNVYNKPKGWHFTWKRPDELRQAQLEGYAMAKGEVATFASSGSKGHHEVAAFGETELVLMKIPEKLFKERQRVVDLKSKERIKGVEATAANEIRAAGGKPYDPSKSDVRHNWSEVKDQN